MSLLVRKSFPRACGVEPSYLGKFEEFRINHDEEGFTVTLEAAGAEYKKMRQVFKKH